MKELSPAAQAIVNAALEKDYGQATPVLLRRLAGALRAVIDTSAFERNYHPDYPETQQVVAVEDLIDIINQLENPQ